MTVEPDGVTLALDPARSDLLVDAELARFADEQPAHRAGAAEPARRRFAVTAASLRRGLEPRPDAPGPGRLVRPADRRQHPARCPPACLGARGPARPDAPGSPTAGPHPGRSPGSSTACSSTRPPAPGSATASGRRPSRSPRIGWNRSGRR